MVSSFGQSGVPSLVASMLGGSAVIGKNIGRFVQKSFPIPHWNNCHNPRQTSSYNPWITLQSLRLGTLWVLEAGDIQTLFFVGVIPFYQTVNRTCEFVKLMIQQACSHSRTCLLQSKLDPLWPHVRSPAEVKLAWGCESCCSWIH